MKFLFVLLRGITKTFSLVNVEEVIAFNAADADFDPTAYSARVSELMLKAMPNLILYSGQYGPAAEQTQRREKWQSLKVMCEEINIQRTKNSGMLSGWYHPTAEELSDLKVAMTVAA